MANKYWADLIKHEAMHDVAFQIWGPSEDDVEYIVLFGEWWNVSTNPPIGMGCLETIKIKKSDRHRWKSLRIEHN